MVGTKGILKVWVRGSSEADCEERGECLRVRVSFVAHPGVKGDWFGCLSESVWTLRECLRDWETESVWVRHLKMADSVCVRYLRVNEKK